MRGRCDQREFGSTINHITIGEWIQFAFGLFVAYGGLCLFAVSGMYLKRLIQLLTFPKSVYTDSELAEAREQGLRYIKLFLWCAAAVF
jgi:hypothetical protein